MKLWERSEALNLLDGFLRESARCGRIALVAGEAGIGKSALVIEFARRCGPRARVLWAACDRLVTPRALGPLHDIGHQIGGRLGAQLRAAAPQEEIFTAFVDELSARRSQPQYVVVVEDVHWADEATLDWLAFLGRRIDRLSALLFVTYRNDEVGPDHPLRGVLAALPHAVVRRVPIEPLSHRCVNEQARRAGRDGESVYQLAGGNPLLVTELLKAESNPVLGAVQDLILDRIRALPRRARDLAQLVAVVPTRADPPLISDASEQVDVCIAAGVLVPAGDGLSFRHELFRSAVEPRYVADRERDDDVGAFVEDLVDYRGPERNRNCGPEARGESGLGHMPHRLHSVRFGRVHDSSPNDRAECFSSRGLGDHGAVATRCGHHGAIDETSRRRTPELLRRVPACRPLAYPSSKRQWMRDPLGCLSAPSPQQMLYGSGSPVAWSHRSLEKEPAAESKLLPSALALGADVVCVAEHPAFYLWFVLASGASHPWIELQRHHIAGDQDRKNQNYFRHGVTPSVCVDSTNVPQMRRRYQQACRRSPTRAMSAPLGVKPCCGRDTTAIRQ